jgi:hypothetical protein
MAAGSVDADADADAVVAGAVDVADAADVGAVDAADSVDADADAVDADAVDAVRARMAERRDRRSASTTALRLTICARRSLSSSLERGEPVVAESVAGASVAAVDAEEAAADAVDAVAVDAVEAAAGAVDAVAVDAVGAAVGAVEAAVGAVGARRYSKQLAHVSFMKHTLQTMQLHWCIK